MSLDSMAKGPYPRCAGEIEALQVVPLHPQALQTFLCSSLPFRTRNTFYITEKLQYNTD